MRYAVGFDIGGTKISVSLGYTENGMLRVLDKIKLSTSHNVDFTAVSELLLDTLHKIVRQNGLISNNICGIGISCGGPLDSKSGVILSPPNLIGWNDVHIKEYFEERLGIRTTLQNDADACAIAEWKYGAGQGCDNMVFLTFGTGFGAGLILNGKLYSGANNMAGEIGHCRSPYIDSTSYSPVGYGKAGSFEGFCSGGGIAELGRSIVLEKFQLGEGVDFCPTMQDLNTLTAKLIGDAAESGDPTAIKIYECSGRHLGAALALLVDILNPETIVIGSIYVRSTKLLKDAAVEVLQKESLERSQKICKVVPAALGEDLGDIAALSIALDQN